MSAQKTEQKHQRIAKPYVPLSTSYYDDQKVMAAGEKAEILFVRSLAAAKRLWSDGVLLDGHLDRIGLSDVVGRAARLVDVGLWTRIDGGYQIVAWDKWNVSADEAQAQIERKRLGAAMTNHKRHHGEESDPNCSFCLEGSQDKTSKAATRTSGRTSGRYSDSGRSKPHDPVVSVPMDEIEDQRRHVAQLEASARTTPPELAEAKAELDRLRTGVAS